MIDFTSYSDAELKNLHLSLRKSRSDISRLSRRQSTCEYPDRFWLNVATYDLDKIIGEIQYEITERKKRSGFYKFVI